MSGLAAARRASWGIGDQALSSLTNFVIAILVARTVTTTDFGAFSLAFAAYILALVVSRGLTSEPLVVRHSHTSQEDWRAATRGATGLAVVVAVLAAVVVLVIAAIVGGLLAEAFLALAIVLPGLLVQDTYRYAFVAKGVPMHAFACDLTWAVILVPALIFVGNGPTTSLAVPILVWGGSGIISAGVGMALGRTLPSVRQARAWFVGTRDLGLRYAAEALIAQAPFQITLFVLGSVAGLAATASLRGAQVLLGPIGMLIIGLSIVGVPEGVRRYRSSGARALRGPTALLSLGAAALTLVWGLALGLLPVEVGEKILGDTWSGASAVLAPVTLGWIGNTLAFGATVGLRVLADSRRSLVGRSADASAEATGGVLGAFAGAAFGAALGLAIGQLFGIFAWWFMFDRAIKASVARGVPSAAPMTEEEEFLELSQASPDPGTAGLPIDDAMTDRQGGA